MGKFSRIMPSTPAQMALLAQLHSFPRDKLERTIEALIAICDLIDGDPEEQQENGDENDDPGDLQDASFTEWVTRGRHKLFGGKYEHPIGWKYLVDDEDAEDDDPDTSAEDAPEGFDPEEDMCSAGDDRVESGAVVREVGLPGSAKPGDDVDEERAQMEDDVPCIPVVTLEPNIFNGQRQLLGYTLPRPTRDGMEPEL